MKIYRKGQWVMHKTMGVGQVLSNGAVNRVHVRLMNGLQVDCFPANLKPATRRERAVEVAKYAMGLPWC